MIADLALLSAARLGVYRALVAAATVIAMIVWTPVARAGWSTPVSVSIPHDTIDGLQLAAGPSGDLLAWRSYDLLPPKREIFGTPGYHYSLAAAGGPFRPERQFPARRAGGSLVDLGDGHVAQLILQPTGMSTERPEVALGSVDARFAKPLPVRGSVWPGRASLAGNSRGELLLAWISSTRSGRRHVWASVRRAGGRFGRPELISASANSEQVTAVVGSPSHRTDRRGFAGDMLVAFASRQGRMLVRLRRHGAGWGRVQDIGPTAVGNVNQVAARIGRDGRTIVVWSHQQLSEGGPLGPGYTQVAVQPGNARRFLPPQTLERDRWAGLPGEPIVAADNGRGFLIAFIAQPGRPANGFLPTVVRAAYSRGNRFGAPQTISAAGQQAGDLHAAQGPRGDIVTWSSSPNPPIGALAPGPAVYAAISAPTANRLGAPQQVSPSERAEIALPIYSPAGDRWLLAWAGRPQFQAPLSSGPAFVRVSFCPGRCQ